MSNTPSLLPCPFCGAPAHGYAIAPHSHSPAVLRLIPELPDHPGSYVIEGQCPCGSGLIGANESEVTARWNRRTPQPVVREPLWIDPNDKTQQQYLPHIGEPVLFCHKGTTYYGKHTGASFVSGVGFAQKHFNTWHCHWMYPPAAHDIAQKGGSNAD